MKRSHYSCSALITLAAHLCRGGQDYVKRPLATRQMLGCVILITLGCGAYGFTLGMGRSWRLGLITMVKFPLLILFTLGSNGLINGMLAQVLGTTITLRQALQLILISFTIFSVIVGALTPVLLFLTINLPRSESSDGSVMAYGWSVFANVMLIVWAALVAHARTLILLRSMSPSHAAAERTYVWWCLGNLILGAQLAWLMRPFFGHPNLEVNFFRAEGNIGNFYSAFADAMQYAAPGVWGLLLLGVIIFFAIYVPGLLSIGRPVSQEKAKEKIARGSLIFWFQSSHETSFQARSR